MLNGFIYHIIEHIYSRDDDILRLEYISACKLMEKEHCIIKALQYIPISLFEPLLQAVIHKYYLEFIINR